MKRSRWALGATVLAGIAGGVTYAIGRAGVVRAVTPYSEHWRALNGVTAADELVLVALGDSAAQGVGASVIDHGYVPVLARRLAHHTGREVRVINLSVSGAVSDDVVTDQLPLLHALDVEPDLVTLDIGGNDVVFPGHDPATFAASMNTILADLPAGSFVADVPWIPLPGMRRTSIRMAHAAAELIAQHSHHHVRLHELTRGFGVVGYRRYLAADWFHPNDAGYLGWADAFWQSIRASGRLDELTAQ